MDSMNDGLKRVAFGYTRVSSEEQVAGASLENQTRAIQRYADENNIEIIGWYSDDGISGKDSHRPSLQQMLKDIAAQKGHIDHVIVYNLSRISRNLNSFCKDIGDKMARCGVTLRSTQEVIDETPTGKLLLNLAIAIHQYDNDIKSQTVKDNMRLLAKQGWWMSQAPLGLRLKHVLVDGITTKDGKKKYHNTLEIDTRDDIGNKITLLLNRFSEGGINVAGLLQIAHKLNVKTRNGELIKFSALYELLKQPAYAGYNASKKLLDGEMTKLIDFDGIINLDTYNQNQRLLKGDARVLMPSIREQYPLKHTLLCSKCGKPIRASAPTSGSGKSSPRYHCCEKGHGSISIKRMHRLFANYLRQITPAESTVKMFKVIVKRTYSQKLNCTNNELAKCREEISKIDTKLNEVLDALLDGRISRAEKERYSDAQMRKRDELDKRILKLEQDQRISESTIDYVCSFITKPAKLWVDANLESRQAFQATMFPNGLHFDIGEQKFGTEDLSPLFSVISNKKEPSSDSDSEMVGPSGIEPLLYP